MLENTFRDKIWTGEEAKAQTLEIENSTQSLDSTEVDTKQLNKYNHAKRLASIDVNQNNSQLAISKGHYPRFKLGKHSLGDTKLKILENQLIPHTTVNVKEKLNFGNSKRHKKSDANKSMQRYNKALLPKKTTKGKSLDRSHNTSVAMPSTKRLEGTGQKLRRYAEVNASVDAHLSKFEHLIPDLQRK